MNEGWVLSVVEYRRRTDKQVVRDKVRTPAWSHDNEESMQRAIAHVYDTLNGSSSWEREWSRQARARVLFTRVRLIRIVGQEC